MAPQLKRPTDPYDPSWVEYRRQNPGLRLSLSAADPGDAVDLSSFLPDTYKGDDGNYDIARFKTDYDELASFKSQADEASAAMPQEASGYAFAIPEEFQFPEGFDVTAFQQAVLDNDGKEVLGDDGKPSTRDFAASDLIDLKDPDIQVLQEALLKHGAKPELMGDLASILAGREMRDVMKAADFQTEEKNALGPNAQSRIDTVKRTVSARVPAAQAKAIMDGITSADGLRGMEAMLKATTNPPNPAPGSGIDNATASVDDRIMAGLSQRKA